MTDTIVRIWQSTGLAHLDWRNVVMLVVACGLVYLAIGRKQEPVLLLPLAVGMLLANLCSPAIPAFAGGGLMRALQGLLAQDILPLLLMLCIGATTDFGPLLASPKSLLLGAAAQLGVFLLFFGAVVSDFSVQAASAVGLAGSGSGAAIYGAALLAPERLGVLALAAALCRAIGPWLARPIAHLLTTKRERQIAMQPLRTAGKREIVLFDVLAVLLIAFLLPAAAPLMGMLMLGNLLRVSGAAERLSETALRTLAGVVTVLLGLVIGASAVGEQLVTLRSLELLAFALLSLALNSASGVLLAKLINCFLREKINPAIGAAGVPAGLVQMQGIEEESDSALQAHAAGVQAAGLVASTVAAGVLLTLFL